MNFPRPDGNEEKDVVRDGADTLGEVGDVADLVSVPVDDGGMKLERQPRLLARLNALHG